MGSRVVSDGQRRGGGSRTYTEGEEQERNLEVRRQCHAIVLQGQALRRRLTVPMSSPYFSSADAWRSRRSEQRG